MTTKKKNTVTAPSLTELQRHPGLDLGLLVRMQDAGVEIPEDLCVRLGPIGEALTRCQDYVTAAPEPVTLEDMLSDDWRAACDRYGVASVAGNRGLETVKQARKEAHARASSIVRKALPELHERLNDRFVQLVPKFAEIDDGRLSRFAREELTEQRRRIHLAHDALLGQTAGNPFHIDNDSLAQWCLMFSLTPELHKRLIGATGAGVSVPRGSNAYRVGLEIGAEPRLAYSAEEALAAASALREGRDSAVVAAAAVTQRAGQRALAQAQAAYFGSLGERSSQEA